MADLRNAFTVSTDDGTRDLLNEELTANGMGALRRGWNVGQLGSEANYLAAQELGLRNEGRHAEADGLRAKIAELQQRQQMYAPQVGRVEDIGGVGDAVSWAATQMGQGAASMADPMALAAGVGAAGRVAGMVKNPVTQMFSKAAPYLAGAGAYGVNQRQLTGEMGNSMAADPEVMARTTPQQRWETANEFGAGAALIDTIVPGHLAGKVAGKGALRAFGKTGVLGELGMEGATEAVQEHTSQQVLGSLNPSRDTSGDASDLINAFAGGAVGAGGPVAVGAGAQRLHSMANKTVDAVGEKAGDMVDLANGAATAAKEKGKGFLGGVKGLFGKTEATDLGDSEKTPSKGSAEGQNGATAPFQLTPEEYDTLSAIGGGAHPGSPEFESHMVKRDELTVQKVRELAESHPEMAQFWDRMTNATSAEDSFRASDEASERLREMHDRETSDAKGKAMEQNLKALGSLAGRGVAAVAKGVAKGAAIVGKAAWDGATSKKNEQAAGPDQDRSELASSYAEDVAGKLHEGRRGVRVLARRVTEQIIEHMSMRSSDRMYSPQRNVEAHGLGNRDVVLNRLSSTVKKIYGKQAQTVLDEVAKIMNGHGKKVVDYIKKEVETLSAPEGRVHERNRRAQLADTLLSMVPPKKEAALTADGINIRDGADREKFLSLMEDFADGAGAPGLRNQLNAVFGPATVKQMVDHLNGTEIARGKDEKPAKESSAFAQSGHEGEELGEGFEVNDDGEITDYEKRQGDKQVSKSGAPKLYGFKNTQTTRNSSEWSNPFAGARVSESALRDWRAASEEAKTMGKEPPEDPRLAAAAKRPSLFGKDDTLSDGRNAIEARIEALRSKMGDKVSSWNIEAKRASDVMKEMGASDDMRISTYRDYLRKALGAEKGTVEQKSKWKAEVEMLGRVLKDMHDKRSGRHADTKTNVADNGDPESSGIKSLGKERFEAAHNRANEARKKYEDLRKAYKPNYGPASSLYEQQQAMEKYLTDEQAMSLGDAEDRMGHMEIVVPEGKFVVEHRGDHAETEFYPALVGQETRAAIVEAGKAAKEAMAEYRELAVTINAQNAPRRIETASTPGERRKALARADNYLANRYIVVAEDMTNRAPEDISVSEVESMSQSGTTAMDNARKIVSTLDSRIKKAGLTGAEANQMRKSAQREYNEVVDAYNILEFAPVEDGDKPVYIKAGDLVYWARTQRNKGEVATKESTPKFSRNALDHEYLNDLMTGISTILASGLVGARLPTKRNKFGKPEAFETPQQGKNGRKPSVADSVPDSLRLITMTAGQMRWKPETQDTRGPEWAGPPDFEAGGDDRADEVHQAAVIKDQRRGGEPTVVDPLRDAGEMRTMDPQDYAALTTDERKTLNGFADRYSKAEGAAKAEIAREQREFLDGLSLRKDGKRYSTAVNTTSSERQRREAPNILKGEKPNPYAGESHRAVHKDEPRNADQIRRDRRMRNADGTKREVFEDGAAFPVEMTDDEISPMDFFPDQEPGAVPDEFADAQFRNRIEGYDASTTVGAEFKLSAASKAKERGLAIRAKLLLGRGERSDQITPKQLEGINEIAARIRSAYRPERREKGDDGLVGGWHYLYPVAHALNTDVLRKMAGGKDPADLMPTLKFLRDQFKRALLDSAATPSQKAAVLRAASPAEWASKITEGNVIQLLERDAPARDEGLLGDAMLNDKAAPEVAAQSPKSQSAPAGARKLNAMSGMSLDDKLTSILAERGIVVTRDALEGMPTEDRISLVSRTLRADPSQTMAPDVARFVSWMVVGSDFYSRVDAGIAGTQMEKDIMAKVDRDPRQSLYIPTRKRREVVRQATEQLLAYGLYKRYAQEGTLSQKLLAVVKEAARYAIEALGGVSFRTLQAEADRLVDGVLSGEIKLERPRKEGSVLMDPNKAFAEDQHAANIVYGLTEGGGFALTGSLAYAAQGTVYRPAGVPIHDLDLTTNLSQKSAEARLTRLYPQAELVRAFGGLGSFVTTYVVPPKGYTVSDVAAENGAIKGYTVRQGGKVVGRYEHTEKGETQSGVRATVVDLIGDARTDYASMVIPTAFGDKRVPVSHYRDAMAEKLVYARDKDITDFVNFVPHDRKLNQQNQGPNRVATQKEMDDARAYIKKIAPDVKLAFKDITGYSGEFIEAENAIEISTTSPAGVMEVAYHEALHAFFAKFVKSDPKVFAALSTLAENHKLIERVHALLKGYPAAQRQLADGEERLAYIFQFWAAGKLDLPVGRPTTLMQKIRKFFRRVAGMISKEERAADLLHAFHNGELSEPSAAGRVIADIMNQGTFTPKQLRKMDKLVQNVAGLVVPSETILAKSESAAARALAKDFYTNPGDEDSAGHGEGLLNATRTTAAKNVNRFAGAIRGLSDRDLTDVARYMQQGAEVSDIPYAPHREAVKEIRQHLEEFYDYMRDRGMKMGKINEKYFPVSWSLNKLTLEADKFKKMLTDNYADKLDEAANAAKVPLTRDDVAGRIWQALIDRNGTDGKIDVTRDDGVLAPFFANSEHRELNWIAPEHSEPFLHKNLVAIMTGYIHQGVKAAEYTDRFGRDGKILDDKLTEVHNELKEIALAKLNAQEFDGKEQADEWVASQMKNIKRATGAMEGSLGKDISPALRNFNSWMMVYQNLRLLPLTLFASFVDPLGMVARGATMKEAYETFLRGMREVFTNWADMVRSNPKERQADKWELLAEHIGALDAIMLSHHVSEEYSSTYLSGGAKKINDTLFKLNGMEAWNRGVRAGAVRSAVKFIARHSKLPEVHSKRWLDELSLTDDHIALDNDGELILDANELANAKGISVPEAKRRVEALHSAINRWVVGAVLTPNSAQRPAWASDPHYSVFFHLKQFSYSFHQTILKRAVREMNHGNLAPIGAFAGYIPAMIASDVVKGLIVGGGQLPDYMKSYNLGDWVKHGVERSGTLGIAGIGVDASHDIFSLAGPGVEQVMDAMVDPIGQTTLNALPVHGLYAGLLK